MRHLPPVLPLALLLLSVPCLHADVLIRYTAYSVSGGKPGAKLHLTQKIKGHWIMNQIRIDLPPLPAGIQLPANAAEKTNPPPSYVNTETGETWTVKNGKAERRPEKEPGVAEEIAKKSRGNIERTALASAVFESTGKTEKVGGYDTEIWESTSGDSRITVWVAPALNGFKQWTAGFHVQDREAAAKIRKSLSVLPGVVVKQQIEIDRAAAAEKALPPGASMPAFGSTPKSASVKVLEEIQDTTFSEADFPLPQGLK